MPIPAPIQSSKAAPRLALPWIVRLRYAMAAGQALTAILVDRVLAIPLPLGWIAVPVLTVVASNIWLARRARADADPGESSLIAGIFVLDTLCLTAVLMLTGGANNPFSLLYLVHITLSAIILTRRQTWALGALACVAFAAMFGVYRPIPQLEAHHYGQGANLHLIGMWVGFAIASGLVALFSGKISELLREREASLLAMQDELAKKDRLAALVTLAAGAAHELNTPLGTIAVVAKELERYATATGRDTAIADDSRLIRTEVERCREILQRMSTQGAEPAGEALESVPVAALLNSVQLRFPAVQVTPAPADLTMDLPRHAVEQALIALVKNASEASPAGARVTLCVSESVSERLGTACFRVTDQGAGMTPEALRHLGEPFFSTKEPGFGMGLGVFLVRTLAQRLGGRLTVDSAAGVGTTAVLELPISQGLAHDSRQTARPVAPARGEETHVS